jgi:hypothetical protein
MAGLHFLRKENVMKKILLSVLLIASFSANAAVVSFASNGSSDFSTSGVNFVDGSAQVSQSGYSNVALATSSDYVAFNPYEVSPSTFTWNNPGTFDLTSFVIAGAWGSQTLNIAGYNGNSLVGSSDLFVTNAASVFTANWSALTHFIITTGTDFVSFNLGGSGQHWALNDITVNENLNAVPVPAALFMFAPALLGFMGFRRRAKNLAA